MSLALIGLILTSVLFVLLGRETTEPADGPPVFTHWIVPQEHLAEVVGSTATAEIPRRSRDAVEQFSDSGDPLPEPAENEALDPGRYYASFVDEEGRPLAGARVVIHTRPAQVIATAESLTARLDERPELDTELVTDDEGRIDLSGETVDLSPRIFEAEVIAEGYARQRYRLVDPGRRRRYRVGRPAILGGRVTERRGDEPVAGILVELFDASGFRHTARSDHEGNYRIEGIAPGAATLRVLSPDYLRVIKWLRLESASREEQTISLSRGGRLLVRVADLRGALLPEVDVKLIEMNTSPELVVGTARTDLNGEAEFGGLRAGRRYLIAIDDADRGTARQRVAGTLEAPKDADWSVEEQVSLVGNWSLRGRAFVALDGRPAPDAWVILESEAVPGLGGIRHRTPPVQADAEGRFEVGGLIDGLTYTAMIFHQNFALRILPTLTEEGAGDIPVQVDLQDRQRVFGEVRDAEGAPVPFATVFVSLPTGKGALGSEIVVQADAEGRYSLDHFPPGVRVLIQAKDNQRNELSTVVERVTGVDGAERLANLTTHVQD